MSSIVLSSDWMNEPWGDWAEEHYTTLPTVVEETVDEQGWEVVNNSSKPEVKPELKPWCTYGNACAYKNCKNRHETCEHHAKWLANGKTGHSCRSLREDPFSCKSPMYGGCKYDHRDHSKLQTWVDNLPCSSETEIWESFGKFRLEASSSYLFDTSEMERRHKGLLFASLIHDGVEYEYNKPILYINFTN